jgi:hypothetical protein
MDVEGVVFCEGTSDKTLLDGVTRRMKIANLEMVPIGGGISHLDKIAPQIRRRHDEGRRVGLILDANSDPADRRRSLDNALARLELTVFDTFFLPNNRDPGCLEDVLEGLAVEDHRAIYDCLANYERCLMDCGPGYQAPHAKGKIYAYCEALGIETRDRERDYTDNRYWNLEAAALEPLKQFLKRFASG